MIFHSLVYVVFLLVVLTLYWPLGRRERNLLLLAASWVFYGWVDRTWLLLLIATSLADCLCLRGMVRFPEWRRGMLLASVVSNFTVLGVFKYFDFFSASMAGALEALGIPVHPTLLNLVLPAGISFYTFQSVSFVVDVYRGKLDPPGSMTDFLLFVAFFPQLVAGPIERGGHLMAQITAHRIFDLRIVRGALVLLAWGYYKKLVIADNAAVVTNRIFSLEEPSFPLLWAGVFAFGVQIYADFSAYTDIARGSGRLLGFDLCENFRHPILADSPPDFWRRWHISLSTWFRDYVYIPLGGSRCSLRRQCRNLFLTFFLSGLWHGAAWNFVLWGTWHAVLVIAWVVWERSAPDGLKPGRIPRILRIGITFVLVHIGWLMFREQSFPHLLAHFSRNPLEAAAIDWRAGVHAVSMTLLYAFPLWIHPIVDRMVSPSAAAEHFPGWRWTTAMTALVLVLYLGILLLRSPSTSDFIYFQF